MFFKYLVVKMYRKYDKGELNFYYKLVFFKKVICLVFFKIIFNCIFFFFE